MKFRLACSLLALTAITPCDSPSIAPNAHTVTDSAGVRIVVSKRALWGPEPATLDTTPMMRIGPDTIGPASFSFIGTGVLFPDGRISVAELATSEFRLFSKDGVDLSSVGRRGRGPGEYQVLSGAFAFGDDSLITHDQSMRRSIVRALGSGDGRVLANPVDGNLFAFGLVNGSQMLLYDPGTFRRDAAPGLQWDTTDVALFDLRDGTGRVIARLPSRQRFYEGGDARVLSPAHYAFFATTANGFCWVASDRYEMRCFNAEGTLTQIVRRPVEARPVDAAMVQRWIEASLDQVRQREGEAGVARSRATFEAAVHGERAPLFQQMFVDRDQRLWLGESAWPETVMFPRRWSVFGADGVWLGDVAVPSGFRALDSRGELVLGVWPDQVDVPRVQLHKILKPQQSLCSVCEE